MSDSARPLSTRWMEWPHWLLWFSAVLPICWRQITTSDLWWHVELGRWLVTRRTLPDYAQFYFTPLRGPVEDLRWSALGDVILFGLHSIGGACAIQVASFSCVFAGCFLLRKLWRGPMNGWVTALLVLVAIGTYQLQLPRNAMFSLPLTALLFLLFSKFQTTRRVAFAWLMALLVGVWSYLHGSYLLGVVLVALLLAGDVLMVWRSGWRATFHRALPAAGVAAATLLAVSFENPAAWRMLQRPLLAAVGQGNPALPNERSAVAGEPSPAATLRPASVARWLNNLIWPEQPNQVRSADFFSPFDRLGYRPVLVSFFLTTFAAIWLIAARVPPLLPWLLAFAATAFLGLSYFRMVGYVALGAAAFILTSPPLRYGWLAPALARRESWGVWLTVLVALGTWSACFTGRLPALLGNFRHVFAIGCVPTFDAAACDWLLAHHRERRVFTTIVTGSFALHRWHGQKPVFIDGFFAPHHQSLWRDYRRARADGGAEFLRERYGVELALVEHGRQDWNRLFLTDPQWQPAAVGIGCTVYAHRSTPWAEEPQLLTTPTQVDSLPPAFRRVFARDYYAALLALLAAERPAAARHLANAAPDGYRVWRNFLPRRDQASLAEIDGALGLDTNAMRANASPISNKE